MKKLFFLLILLSFGVEAKLISSKEFRKLSVKDKVKVVEVYRAFFTSYQSQGLTLENRVTQNRSTILDLIQPAYADDAFNCFYAGWPSVSRRVSASRQVCTSPASGNPSYSDQASSCGAGSLLCQPALFGAGLCVPVRTQSQRNQAFSNCEKQFRAEGRSIESVAEALSKDEMSQSADELFSTAERVCSREFQASTGMCRRLQDQVASIRSKMVVATTEPMVAPVVASAAPQVQAEILEPIQAASVSPLETRLPQINSAGRPAQAASVRISGGPAIEGTALPAAVRHVASQDSNAVSVIAPRETIEGSALPPANRVESEAERRKREANSLRVVAPREQIEGNPLPPVQRNPKEELARQVRNVKEEPGLDLEALINEKPSAETKPNPKEELARQMQTVLAPRSPEVSPVIQPVPETSTEVPSVVTETRTVTSVPAAGGGVTTTTTTTTTTTVRRPVNGGVVQAPAPATSPRTSSTPGPIINVRGPDEEPVRPVNVSPLAPVTTEAIPHTPFEASLPGLEPQEHPLVPSNYVEVTSQGQPVTSEIERLTALCAASAIDRISRATASMVPGSCENCENSREQVAAAPDACAQFDAPATTILTPADSLEAAMSSPLTYVGKKKFPGFGDTESCIFQNGDVYVVYHYCVDKGSKREAGALGVEIISKSGSGTVQMYVESSEAQGLPSQTSRANYDRAWRLSYYPSEAPAASMTPEQMNAYRTSFLNGPACSAGGMMATSANPSCREVPSSISGQWSGSSSSFWTDPGQRWVDFQRTMRANVARIR